MEGRIDGVGRPNRLEPASRVGGVRREGKDEEQDRGRRFGRALQRRAGATASPDDTVDSSAPKPPAKRPRAADEDDCGGRIDLTG